MQNLQKLVWILSIVPLSSHQNEMDNIGIYNALENHSFVGIWTLQNENAEIYIYQVQGIVNFFHNSIIYKDLSHDDQQVEQFSGEISLNNVQLTSIMERYWIDTYKRRKFFNLAKNAKMNLLLQLRKIIGPNQLMMQKQSLFSIPAIMIYLTVIFNKGFSTQKLNSSENSLLQILIWSLVLIFCIFSIVLPSILLKFVSHKTIKLSYLSLIGLFFKFLELLFILQLDPYYGLKINFYISLVAGIMYILLLLVWFSILIIVFLEKMKNNKILRRCLFVKFLIIVSVIEATIVCNMILFNYCNNSLLFQLTLAFILFPQIIHNIRWNCKENFNLFYLFGYLSSGLLFITYLKFYQAQTNDKGQDYLFFSLFNSIYFISLFLIFYNINLDQDVWYQKWILDKYYQVCAICLNSIVEFDMEYQLQLLPIILTKCKHKCHEKCLRQWLQQKNDCPLCRNEFLKITQIVN